MCILKRDLLYTERNVNVSSIFTGFSTLKLEFEN